MSSENEPLNVPQVQPNQPSNGAEIPPMKGSRPSAQPHPRQGQSGQKPGGAPHSPSGQRPNRPSRPSGNKPQGPANKRNLVIGLGIVVIVIVVALLIWLFACGGIVLDSNAREGQAPYKTADEIQAELDRQVEEGMFNISIASVIEFADGGSEGTAYIENVPGNRYNMQVTITDDDNGEVLYESGILKPNQYIENIKLNKDLEEGQYPATATFTALNPDNGDEVGKAAAKVTLSVLG